MAEIVKKATRDSFGEAVTKLAETYPKSSCWMQTLLLQPKPAYSKRHIPIGSSIAALQRATW